jgi:hypothetical protein
MNILSHDLVSRVVICRGWRFTLTHDLVSWEGMLKRSGGEKDENSDFGHRVS